MLNNSSPNDLCIINENLNLNPETHCLWTITVLKLWFHSLETVSSGFSHFSFMFSLSQVAVSLLWGLLPSRIVSGIVKNVTGTETGATMDTVQVKLLTHSRRTWTLSARDAPCVVPLTGAALMFEQGKLQQALRIVRHIGKRCGHHELRATWLANNKSKLWP